MMGGIPLRVWLLHIGEELPVDGAKRKFRYGYLAHALAERGHQVLRWAPTFRHLGKAHRFPCDQRVEIAAGYAIQFIHSPGYRRNVGLDRLRTYRVLGRRFRQLAKFETPPDIIVAAIPSLEWAEAAVDYGRSRNIPVVIDVRDLWPDVFLNAFPKRARSVARFMLAGYERAARRICAQATALAAVSPGYLQWALVKAGRQIRPSDSVLPIGFEPESVPAEVLEQNLAALHRGGIDRALPTCLFTGQFERSYDLKAAIEAARQLSATDRTAIQFIFCGDGSKMPALKRQAAELRNVHFLGWVDSAMLQAAMSISSIGLCAYADDALQSWPNKPFEYMAGGLAILSSLRGDLAQLLSQHQCGLTYRAGDPSSLAKCLRDLLQDPSKVAAMRSHAFAAWSENYCSSEIYGRYVSHLQSMTQSVAKAA